MSVSDFEFYGYWPEGASCSGSKPGGYGDIGGGTAVVVSDASGHVIATGRLDSGVTVNHSAAMEKRLEQGGAPPGMMDWVQSTGCVYSFVVDDIPDQDFYSLTISHRGEQTYSAQELAAVGWQVNLSLG